MERSKKVLLVVLLVAGFAVFGYSQYASVSQMGVTITDSELVGEDGVQSSYSVQLLFDNPSLLYLTAGQTEFIIYADGSNTGHGTLAPFALPPLSTTHVNGTFQTYGQRDDAQEEAVPAVKISGTTQYDMIITSIDVPFVFSPTEEQAREFIR